MQIISRRGAKYAPIDKQGVLDETATFLDKLRKLFRRRQR